MRGEADPQSQSCPEVKVNLLPFHPARLRWWSTSCFERKTASSYSLIVCSKRLNISSAAAESLSFTNAFSLSVLNISAADGGPPLCFLTGWQETWLRAGLPDIARESSNSSTFHFLSMVIYVSASKAKADLQQHIHKSRLYMYLYDKTGMRWSFILFYSFLINIMFMF